MDAKVEMQEKTLEPLSQAPMLEESSTPKIQRLTQSVINRISAGEVLERPAAAVKELVENALDANATRIRITIRHGGKSLIRVQDDGIGMSKDNLLLATERHATSKLASGNLTEIHTFGFRGEALAAIAAVSRMTITTHQRNQEPIEIFVEGGRIGACKTSAQQGGQQGGTSIEVQDLFFATPARLRFLRGDAYESALVLRQIESIAMANSSIEFEFFEEKRRKLHLPAVSNSIAFQAMQERITQVLGSRFTDNAFPLSSQNQRMRLQALCALPTVNTNRSAKQFIYVNDRPIQDKSLSGTIRFAYGDSIPARRFPIFVMFLNLPAREVDVNVHPSKTEVRFRDAQALRLFILSTLKNGLDKHARREANAEYRLGAIEGGNPQNSVEHSKHIEDAITSVAQIANRSLLKGHRGYASAPPSKHLDEKKPTNQPLTLAEGLNETTSNSPQQEKVYIQDYSDKATSLGDSSDIFTGAGISWESEHPLGEAKACLHKNYVVAQNKDGFVLVDSHAAHERLLYERLKRDYASQRIAVQKLLIPEIVPLSASDLQMIEAQGKSIRHFGFLFELFDENNLSLHEIPALLRSGSAITMIEDLCALLREENLTDSDATSLLSSSLVDRILSKIACHAAVRSNQILSIEEMNTLLRNLEKEPKSGQCNHGRPTYISFSIKELEKLFERR